MASRRGWQPRYSWFTRSTRDDVGFPAINVSTGSDGLLYESGVTFGD
jgi:hypothetical protein